MRSNTQMKNFTINTAESMSGSAALIAAMHDGEADIIEKVGKGAWRMPWLMEAMKDVISCDKLWVGANDH